MKEKYTLEEEINAILNSFNRQPRLETRHDFFDLLIERIQKNSSDLSAKNKVT